jgi:hypothetical protein
MAASPSSAILAAEAASRSIPIGRTTQWKRQGILTVTEGNTTDYDLIEATVLEDCHATACAKWPTTSASRSSSRSICSVPAS